MHKNIIIIGFLFIIISIMFLGCGEDIPLMPKETLRVEEIKATQSTLGVGDTTTLEAVVDYTGDQTVLMYTWTANAGNIQGSGNRVTYKAPNTPGTYLVSVKVTDGTISSSSTIEIYVTAQSIGSVLIIDRDTYFPAEATKDKLSYDVKVTKLSSKKVLLHYDITQKNDKFDAFLSIEINNIVVQKEMAIGNEQPSTGERTIRDIDVSNVIKSTGRYVVTFYIRPGDRARNGWLLNEAKLIGAEGSSDPQQ